MLVINILKNFNGKAERLSGLSFINKNDWESVGVTVMRNINTLNVRINH